MQKSGLSLVLGLSVMAMACNSGSKGADQKKSPQQGADDTMGPGGGRWGGPGMRRGRGPKRLLRLLDTDGDGVISKGELAKAGKALAKLDKNGDGKLTPDEIRPKWRRGMRGGRGWRGMGGPGGPGWRGGMGGPRWRGGMGRGRGWRGGPGGPGCQGGMGGPGCPGMGGRGMGPGWGSPGCRGGMGGPGCPGMGGRGWRGGMGPGRGWRGMGPGRGWRGGPWGPGGPAALKATSAARNPAEKKILDVLTRLDGQRSGMANVPEADGRMLRLLVGLVNAKQVVEIGTSNGYSTLWMALGLLSTGGKVTTFELNADKIKLAQKHFAEAGVTGRITLVPGDAHKNVAQVKGPIDLLFLDADKSGYLDYLKKLLPKVRAGGVIVAHNMVFPPPDPAFLKAITTDKSLELVFLNLQGPGLAVALKKRGK